MNTREITQFLKDNLDIEVVEERAAYGDGSWTSINLLLDGDIIASATIDNES